MVGSGWSVQLGRPSRREKCRLKMKNILDEMVLTKINEYYEFLFLEMDFIKNKNLTEVGFEPTPPKRLEP